MQQSKKQPSDVTSVILACKKSDKLVCQPLIDEESNFINWLHICAAHGLLITYDYFFEEVLHSMQVSSHGQISRDVVERWVSGFRRRWADRLHSGPAGPLFADESVPCSGALWYRTVSAAIANRYPAVPFNEPERLLLLGELNIHLDGHSAAVRRLRTEDQAATACRDNVAFVMAVSASGERVPPMMVTPPGGLVRGDLLAQDDCLHQTTSNGTVTPDTLRRYVVECLEPHLMASQVPRPVLVYVDGRHHHSSQALSRFCDDAGLILIGLPPGAAARSPLRGAITGLLSANLIRIADSVHRGRRREPAGGCSTSARSLLTGFRTATRRATPEGISHAFQWSGLSPWSESIISACEIDPLNSGMAEEELPPPASPPLPAPVGLPIPPGGLELERTVRLLLNSSLHQPPLEPAELPRPGPESVAFLVKNQNIIERLRTKERPSDIDDGWVVSSTCDQTYLLNENIFQRVYRNEAGRFCLRECVKKELESLLTPNDTIVQVQWARSVLRNSTACTRRVTFISASHSEHLTPPSVALYEFYQEEIEPVSSQASPSTNGKLSHVTSTSKDSETSEETRDRAAEPMAEENAPALRSTLDGPVRGTEYTTLQIPPTGLPANKLIRFLLDPTRHGIAPSRPPLVKTSNTAYLINNEANRERQWCGLLGNYADGPERWEGGGNKPAQVVTYLLDDSGARQVTGLPGCYAHRVQRDGAWMTVPLDPPVTGEETEVHLRQVTSRQLNGTLLRRISWVDRCDPLPGRLPAVALYEYMDDSASGSQANSPPIAEKPTQVEPSTDCGAEREEDSGSESVAKPKGRVKRAKIARGQPVGATGNVKRQRQKTEG